MLRRTIINVATLTGRGLHTGENATVTISPGEANSGVKIQRSDLENQPIVSADINYVGDTNRSTTLKKGNMEVKCTEHLLSAISGLGLTDIHITLDGPEVPILDGSASPFVKALIDSGLKEIESKLEPLVIESPFQFSDNESGASYTVLPSNKFDVTVLIDFNSEELGQQYAHWCDKDSYEDEIAPCKTFVFAHELSALLQEGLIKGGDLNNAIVIADQRITKEDLKALASKLDKSDLNIEGGIVNPNDLHFSNEPARHKVLDLIGDLALLGRPIQAKIIANKPGHKGNVALTKEFKKLLLTQRKLKGKPKYDPTDTPVLNIEQLKALLPHRYPFLMVDKIIEMNETKVVGVKNVTGNEELFLGHFPGNPVFPGVLQMEALAQTGGILALNTVEDPTLWDTYFLKMDNVKFKSMVIPGDTIILKMELLSPIRRGIVHMQGTAYVGNKIVSEGELTAQIIKRT